MITNHLQIILSCDVLDEKKRLFNPDSYGQRERARKRRALSEEANFRQTKD
jgi:hypothetical protein